MYCAPFGRSAVLGMGRLRCLRLSGRYSTQCRKIVTYSAAPLPNEMQGFGEEEGDTSLEDMRLTSGFYSKEHVSFRTLGISENIAQALIENGITRPSYIQEKAMADVGSGEATVIAAETGCGKTLAYLVPIIDKILQIKEVISRLDPQKWNHTHFRTRALVLCVNLPLAEQVHEVIRSLRHPQLGVPLVTSRIITLRHPPPRNRYDDTDIIVSTPAALVQLLEVGGSFGEQWKLKQFGKYLRFVVLDETDVQLEAMQGLLKTLTDNFRLAQRRSVRDMLQRELGMDPQHFRKLPPFVIDAAGKGEFPSDIQHLRISAQAQIVLETCMKARQSLTPASEVGHVYCPMQYIYVGASMLMGPVESASTAITQRHESVNWCLGNNLHRISDRVNLSWHPIENLKNWVAEVTLLLLEEGFVEGGRRKVLVFTSDQAVAQRIMSQGRSYNLPMLHYHAQLDPDERYEARTEFRQSRNIIMVTTDAMSRGLDIPDITSVIHAPFPALARDFLHRTGRVGRAGRSGRVAVFYSMHDDLALKTREVVEKGEALDRLFVLEHSVRRQAQLPNLDRLPAVEPKVMPGENPARQVRELQTRAERDEATRQELTKEMEEQARERVVTARKTVLMYGEGDGSSASDIHLLEADVDGEIPLSRETLPPDTSRPILTSDVDLLGEYRGLHPSEVAERSNRDIADVSGPSDVGYYRKPEQLMRSLGVGQPIPMERWNEVTQQVRDLDDKLEIMRALREREERIRIEHAQRQAQEDLQREEREQLRQQGLDPNDPDVTGRHVKKVKPTWAYGARPKRQRRAEYESDRPQWYNWL